MNDNKLLVVAALPSTVPRAVSAAAAAVSVTELPSPPVTMTTDAPIHIMKRKASKLPHVQNEKLMNTMTFLGSVVVRASDL